MLNQILPRDCDMTVTVSHDPGFIALSCRASRACLMREKQPLQYHSSLCGWLEQLMVALRPLPTVRKRSVVLSRVG